MHFKGNKVYKIDIPEKNLLPVLNSIPCASEAVLSEINTPATIPQTLPVKLANTPYQIKLARISLSPAPSVFSTEISLLLSLTAITKVEAIMKFDTLMTITIAK